MYCKVGILINMISLSLYCYSIIPSPPNIKPPTPSLNIHHPKYNRPHNGEHKMLEGWAGFNVKGRNYNTSHTVPRNSTS